MPKPLKLLAKDSEDIAVIAAILQDSIAPVCEMAFRAEDSSFIMILQRFCWDDEIPEETIPSIFSRIHTALDIRGVVGAQKTGFEQGQCGSMLDLLTITLDAPYLNFVFAGGAELRLRLENWSLQLEDFGPSWPTTHKPKHFIEENDPLLDASP